MHGYHSVFTESECEKVIERSRFIARCAHAEGEEQARAFVARVRAQHSLATHNCFAFVADKEGNLLRFSDDGEPQGTAGMPILEVIRSKKLFETTVVVTRYFGGIKLGAGGLVRAYAGAAADVLAAADIRAFTPCRDISLTVGYEHYDAIRRYLSARDCSVKDTQYTDKVCVVAAVRSAEAAAFAAGAGRLHGRPRIVCGGGGVPLSLPPCKIGGASKKSIASI